ncbi:MAG: MG2 domain-containing protein, partial [Bacteroidota bacterium]
MGGQRGIYWADDDPWWWADDDEDNPAAYDWGKQGEPCALEYYNAEHFARRNVFVSNLGLTGKLGRDGSLFLAVNDLHTTRPISNIEIELLDYQLQTILKSRTGEDGTVMLEGLVTRPFLAVASDGASRGYLRMADGGALSLSRFDVAGVEPQRGLRGYIYGERGVWRPGDSLFLNFVLEDKSGRLPVGHPVTMEVSDSRGVMQFRRTLTEGVNGVFPFYFATGADAPTGNWMCKVMVGGATFSKTVKIETVKPNRLKLDLDFGKNVLGSGDFATNDDDGGLQGALRVNWLHGAVAKGLKAKVEMSVNVRKTEFTRYRDFSFDDPSRYFSSEPEVLFDGVVDQNGMAKIP